MTKTTRPTSPSCSCGSHGELRRCTGNGGIAWRCPRCLATLSKWIPHEILLKADIDINALPDWNQAPDNQMGLPL